MQVDAFLRAHRSLDVREVHPELVFLRLNANKPLPSKKSRGEEKSILAFAGEEEREMRKE